MQLENFEKKQLTYINALDKQLNEGLGIGKTILRFLFGSKFKKILNNLSQYEDDYPEYQSALMNLKTQLDKFPEINARGEKVLKDLEREKQEQESRLSKLNAMRHGR